MLNIRPYRWCAATLIPFVVTGLITVAGAGEHSAEAPSLETGITAYRSGAPQRALAVFVLVARTSPTSALPAIWAGIAAVAAGKVEEAEAHFRDGLRRPHSAFQERVTQGWLRKLAALRGPAPIWGSASNAIAVLAHAANPRLTRVQAAWIGAHVVAAAGSRGVDPWLLASVVYVESRFNNDSTSGTGATGLGQLMPDTARAARVDPKDPWENLLGTASLLQGYYRAFKDWTLALAAYNAGVGAVRRYGGVPPFAETQWYVNAVLATYHRIRPQGITAGVQTAR